jgi:trans-AT polyketide synthase/acyltransferase/oxidoreductase domain-containing protein
VNQCTPEAGTSSAVKDMLAALDVPDTAYAPAGDMFELGAKVQVVRKGTLFAARAQKLYELYRRYNSLGEIDATTRSAVEDGYFRRTFADVWRDVTDRYTVGGRADRIAAAERDPRQLMSAVFRWYFWHTAHIAMVGKLDERVNFQIHCGPAMGAFNQFVRNSALEDWQERHPDLVAERLMVGAADVLARSCP